MVSMVSAESFGYGRTEEVPINYSNIIINETSNQSEYWVTDEGTLNNVADIEHNWLSNLLWSVAGHIIDTSLNMNGENITNVSYGLFDFVGIGTSNPSHELNVVGNSNFSGDMLLTTTGGTPYLWTNCGLACLTLQAQTPAQDSHLRLMSEDGDGTDNVFLSIHGVGTPQDVENRERIIIGYSTADDDFHILTEADGTGTLKPLHIETEGNNNQIYLATDGKVGVGTSTPSHELNVVGETNLTGDLIIQSNINMTSGSVFIPEVDGAGVIIGDNGGAITYRGAYDQLQIGIDTLPIGQDGTFSQIFWDTILNGAWAYCEGTTGGSVPKIAVFGGVDCSTYGKTSNDYFWVFKNPGFTNDAKSDLQLVWDGVGNDMTWKFWEDEDEFIFGDNLLTLDEINGNVGINTNAPNTYLDIFGTSTLATTNTENLLQLTRIAGNTYPNIASLELGRYSAGGINPRTRLDINLKADSSQTQVADVTVMTLQSDVKVGIGTTTPQQELNVVGDLNITGNFTGNQIYGEIWSHNDTDFILLDMEGGSVWINISINSTGAEFGQDNNGFGYDPVSSSLIAEVDGKYDCSYDLSTGNTGNNQEYQFALFINGVMQDNTDTHRKIGASGDVGDISDRGWIDLNGNDLLNFRAKNNDGTADLEIHAVSINCLRIGN